MATDGSVSGVCNVTNWIEENKKFFLPPVCNKMMHKDGQMKLFFVGGPNQRKDYHIECGDELFLQVKGDMVLKIVEQNKHRDIHIKQGQMFLLPARIPHSPQRQEETVGLVIERDRHQTELDGLRYYQEVDGKPALSELYEKWFYCEDLGSQLASIIKEYFASEQHETGKPLPGTIPEVKPFELDTETVVEEPFDFEYWLESTSVEIDEHGRMDVFDGSQYQFKVTVYGKGTNSDECECAETWIWQWVGESVLEIGGEEHQLKKGDSYLIPMDTPFTVTQGSGDRTLVCWQDPRTATTWPEDTENGQSEQSEAKKDL